MQFWDALGQRCDATTPTIDADGLTLIEEFDTDQVFLLNPGDALYIPPGYAHWGTAVDESMTARHSSTICICRLL